MPAASEPRGVLAITGPGRMTRMKQSYAGYQTSHPPSPFRHRSLAWAEPRREGHP